MTQGWRTNPPNRDDGGGTINNRHKHKEPEWTAYGPIYKAGWDRTEKHRTEQIHLTEMMMVVQLTIDTSKRNQTE